MAINMAAIEQIVALLDRIIGAQATAAQQQRLEALFQTVLNQGNEIIAREQNITALLSQILGHVSANQTQAAANSLVLAQTYRALQDVPAASADSVWGATNPFILDTYQNAMGVVMFEALLHYFAESPIYYELSPHFLAFIPGPNGQNYTGPARFPAWDDSQILPADTLKSYLDRVSGIGTWEWPILQPHSGYLFNFGTRADPYDWMCIHSEVEFQQYKQILFNPSGTGAANVPPVWPGLANVTLGTPIAITPPGQTVPGPMDGVLVQITSYPQWKGKFVFDTDTSVRNIGQITFQTDNGQDELPQTLGFEQAIYCPRAMTSASKALVRTVLGVTGTITPWVRT